MRQKADSELVRRQNRGLVMSALREGGPMARIELGRYTGLSPASITSIIGQMITDGILQEIAEPGLPAIPMRRGRPLTQIGINPKAAHVVAVKISIAGMELALADARGVIIASHLSRRNTSEADPASFGMDVASDIGRFLASTPVPVRKVARIGVAVQGVADSRDGTIVWSPAFHARNIPVATVIEKQLGIRCNIANDANMIAEGMISADRRRYGGTAAMLFLGYGVGMGLVINGQVYHGPTGAAAEFGHMNHLPGGPLCRCGRRGCVESYAADYSILRWASGDPLTQPPCLTAVPEEDMQALEKRARSGDARARDAFAKAGEALGYGLARTIAMINLTRIVLAGPGLGAADLIEPHLRAAIADGVVEELRRDLEIETVPIGTDMIIRGTIEDALRRLDQEIFALGPVTGRRLQLEKTA